MEQEKIDAFIKEYGELREKHRMDFVSLPVYRPDDNGVWGLTIQTQVAPIDIPSPFVPSHDDTETTT